MNWRRRPVSPKVHVNRWGAKSEMGHLQPSAVVVQIRLIVLSPTTRRSIPRCRIPSSVEARLPCWLRTLLASALNLPLSSSVPALGPTLMDETNTARQGHRRRDRDRAQYNWNRVGGQLGLLCGQRGDRDDCVQLCFRQTPGRMRETGPAVRPENAWVISDLPADN